MAGFNTGLGLKLGEDPHTIELQAAEHHQVTPGMVHFAVLTTMAEVAAAQTVERAVVPAQVSVSLLRPARLGLLVAKGRLVKRGRRLATAVGEVFQEDELVATATVTFAIMG